MELSKRIDNILGPWPTPDQVREALLLLARHLQRQLTSRDVPALVAEVRRLHAERYKAQAEVAEHRRHVATVMQREDALKKRVEELERERDADAEPLEECGEDEVIEQEEAPHAHLHFDVRTGTVEATMSDRPGGRRWCAFVMACARWWASGRRDGG